MADIQTSLRYLNPEWKHREEAPAIGSRESRRANTAYREVTIGDARAATDDFGLETAGFELHHGHREFDATADDRRPYHQSLLELVKSIAGAAQTVLLADLVRTEDQRDFNTAYARFVHCDYNLATTDGMARDLLKRRGLDLDPAWNLVWYNTWQPFDWDVQQHPLAMLDLRSIDADDIIDYRYTGYSGADDPGGADGGGGARVAAPVFNPDHQWWHYPDMTTSEVLLSKQGDHRVGHTTQCPHTSFVDPTRAEDVPPRRSIEARILALVENPNQETA